MRGVLIMRTWHLPLGTQKFEQKNRSIGNCISPLPSTTITSPSFEQRAAQHREGREALPMP